MAYVFSFCCRRRFGLPLVTLVAAMATAPVTAQQQTFWLANPVDNNFSNPANWSNGVPNSATTASFTTSRVTEINVFGGSVGSLNFAAGASPFTFRNFGLSLANGITNASANAPAFVLTNFGQLSLRNGGLANASVSLDLNSQLYFSFFNNPGAASADNARIVSAGTVRFGSAATAGNATIMSTGVVQFFEGSNGGAATIVDSGGFGVAFNENSSAGRATVVVSNGSQVAVTGQATAANSTLIANSGGFIRFFDQATGGQARVVANPGGTFSLAFLAAPTLTIGSIEGAGRFELAGKQLFVGGNDLSTAVNGEISGNGSSLFKTGHGTLILAGANTYTGQTFVSGGGTLAVTGSLAGDVGVSSGSTLLASGSIGGGLLVTPGGVAIVDGRVTGPVTVISNPVFGGNGFIGGTGTLGSLSVGGAILSPGNSIGTLNVVGAFSQSGGTYVVEVSPGQADRVAVGGKATLSGGTVTVTPQPGSYAARTTYTILSAAGGVAGSYASVVGGTPYLSPSLSYDANAVYLTLQAGNFLTGALNPAQAAVAGALDAAAPTATGNFSTAVGALASLSPAQLQPVLVSLSGMNWSGFSNTMVQTAQLFMANFLDRAGSVGRGKRVALAEACTVACEEAEPPRWGAWAGGVGGLGTVGAGQSLGGVTYNLGGFAAGLDRRLGENFVAGVAVGYTGGSNWVSGFSGQGFSNTVQVGLYGTWAESQAYLDGIVGYAYTANQLSRPIVVPGLPAMTASGATGANQVFGQLEGGWRFDLGTAANAWLTPFARLQGYSGTQNGFTESGAQSLSLNVAGQTTSSLRTVLGAQLGGAMELGWRDKLNARLRLGWSHEFADTSRPVTASFVGAPGNFFTTYGASPQRDGAVVGLAADTVIADGTSLYLRYEADIAGQDSTHALTAGVRVRW